MSQVIFRWSPSPANAIGKPLVARMAAVPPAIHALAQSHAARAEGWMKAGAPWNDQTGYARGALYGRAQGTNIHLGTSNEEYGLYLELGTVKMAARPIIVPTVERTAQAYFTDAVLIVRVALGG